MSEIPAMTNQYVDSLYTNPYFWEAFRTQNNYALVNPQVTVPQSYAQLPQATDTIQNNNAKGSVPVVLQNGLNTEGTSDAILENKEKKNSKAGWLLTAVSAVVLAIGARRCHAKGDGNNAWLKILDGAKKTFGEYSQNIRNIFSRIRK